MRVLIDTQCWLWMLLFQDRLGVATRDLLRDPATELFLSTASVWEIAIKHALGKLRLPVPPTEYVPSRLVETRTTALPIQVTHALRVSELPPHHRDPFDRMLVAQAQVEGVPILTADAQIARYDVGVIESAR